MFDLVLHIFTNFGGLVRLKSQQLLFIQTYFESLRDPLVANLALVPLIRLVLMDNSINTSVCLMHFHMKIVNKWIGRYWEYISDTPKLWQPTTYNFIARGCGTAPIGGNHRKGHWHRFHMWPSPSFTCRDMFAARSWNGVFRTRNIEWRWRFTSRLCISLIHVIRSYLIDFLCTVELSLSLPLSLSLSLSLSFLLPHFREPLRFLHAKCQTIVYLRWKHCVSFLFHYGMDILKGGFLSFNPLEHHQLPLPPRLGSTKASAAR